MDDTDPASRRRAVTQRDRLRQYSRTSDRRDRASPGGRGLSGGAGRHAREARASSDADTAEGRAGRARRSAAVRLRRSPDVQVLLRRRRAALPEVPGTQLSEEDRRRAFEADSWNAGRYYAIAGDLWQKHVNHCQDVSILLSKGLFDSAVVVNRAAYFSIALTR